MADEETKPAKDAKAAEAKAGAEGADEKALAPEAKKKQKEKKQAVEKKVVKKVDYGPDFKYIVRIANTDLDGTRKVHHALSAIKGVGARMGTIIVDDAGVPRYELIGRLNDQQVETLAKAVEGVAEHVPGWIVNRPFDYESGDDLHLVGTNVDAYLRDDINRLKKIRSYRGVRHEKGMPVRGQRTRSHGRTGLTVGVQRKKAEEAAKEEKKEEKKEGAPKAAPAAKPGAAPAGAKPATPAAPAKPAEGGKK